MFKGTKNRTAKEISEFIDFEGGILKCLYFKRSYLLLYKTSIIKNGCSLRCFNRYVT